MKKRARQCIVSPEYNKEPKIAAVSVDNSHVRKRKVLSYRYGLYVIPLLVTVTMFLTGFVGLGFNVFLDNAFAGVTTIDKTDEIVTSLLSSPPQKDIKLYPCFVINKKYTSEAALAQKLMIIDGQVFEGSAFICDGKPLFIAENQNEIQSIIAEYIEPYKTEHTTSAELDCKSEIVDGIYKAEEKTEKEKAMELLSGIDVITTESICTIEAVAHTTETVKDSAVKEGIVTVNCEGSDGEMEVAKEIRKVNGELISEKITEQTMVTVPVSRIETLGTKVISGMGTGSFLRPVSGDVSSNYGIRWGKNHNGTDFLGNIGDSVEASDGGTVSFSGASEGYGNLIIIDHKNGYETYYGHLNKSYVSEGDKVESGEIIGEIGSTGNSTGPHLHFEIRKNGIPINPLSLV